MYELITLGINLILLVFAWRVVFKPALRHYVRDKLFDARERLRERFLAEDGGLEHPTYIFLRGFLNHHIRFIEDQSLCKMLYFQSALNADQKTARYIHQRFEALQSHCGEEHQPIIAAYRKSANRWVKFYLVHSSFCLSALFYTVVSVSLVCAIPSILRHVRSRPAHQVRRTYVKRVDQSFEDESVETYPAASTPDTVAVPA